MKPDNDNNQKESRPDFEAARKDWAPEPIKPREIRSMIEALGQMSTGGAHSDDLKHK